MGDDVRVKFYLQLANPTLNKLWEIVTFREFLLDRSSNDEIYFYLFYRNILFQGPQLQSITSTFQAVQYVPWSRVDQLISCMYLCDGHRGPLQVRCGANQLTQIQFEGEVRAQEHQLGHRWRVCICVMCTQ